MFARRVGSVCRAVRGLSYGWVGVDCTFSGFEFGDYGVLVRLLGGGFCL